MRRVHFRPFFATHSKSNRCLSPSLREITLMLPLFLLLVLSATSCGEISKETDFSGGNASELQRLVASYADSTELKRRSAEFLVANMAGHYYFSSPAIAAYDSLIIKNCQTLTSEVMQQWWDSLKANDRKQPLYDAQTLSYSFLRDDIERAVAVWQHTPWHDFVSDGIFLDYVLPYRVKDEPPSPAGWRDSLYNRYHHVIEGISDVKTAFGKLHRHLMDEFKIRNIGSFPYVLCATDAGKMLQGRCIHRCCYVVAVMRSLGIPAALDGVDSWANISTGSHSWAALVTDDGTYTVDREDSVARQFAAIDASVFYIKDTLETDFPLDVSFKKRVSNIWRQTYSQGMAMMDYDDREADDVTRYKFCNPFVADVTPFYGYNGSASFYSLRHRGYAYLCTFRTGLDWTPVTYRHSLIGRFAFKNLPDSVLLLPAYFEHNRMKALDAPFALTSHGIKKFNADTVHLQTMTLNRKYPFSLNSAKSWPQARGACFEASNDRDFISADTLFVFSRTPMFRNEIAVMTTKRYRYVRYRSHPSRHAYISEIEAYSDGRRLECGAFGSGVDNPEACIDGDTFTYLDNVQPGSWVTLDFGKPVRLSRLVLYPKNDGNHVVPGKYYELQCFVDGRWKKYGSCQASGCEAVFKNVPSGGLYRLHCLDGGLEEQIFSYENGQQIWW